MILHIKNMVSLRCKMIVKAVIEELDVQIVSLNLGEVEVREDMTPMQMLSISHELADAGLELMQDKGGLLVEKIKKLIIEMVHYSDTDAPPRISEYLSQELGHNYSFLSNHFSEATGNSIEQFVIQHKIEKAKELILYNELNLTEISYHLNYSSVAHLSNQFKKVTGLTPTTFKTLSQKRQAASLYV